MKLGSVYKVARNNKPVVGIIVEKGKKMNGTEFYKMITTAGGTLEIATDTKTSSTRLKPEVRDALKKVYQTYAQKVNLEKEIKKMENELWEKRRNLEVELNDIKKVSDEFNMDDLAKAFYDIRSYSTNHDVPKFSFYLDKMIAKYASPEDYPFLMREYDGAIFIDNHEACIKKYKLNVTKSDIDELKKQLKYTKLEAVRDDCDMGDKNTIYVSKVLDFTIKKGVKYSEIMKEGEVIQKWMERQKKRIGA